MSSAPSPDLALHRHTLDNGLRVVLHPDCSLPLVAVNVWYHVGSKNERRGRTGLAHLFEHMLFQGSENVGTNDHIRMVQQVGGVANGSTWYDRTNYYETLPSHHLGLGLWLESDRMGFLLPALTPEKLENQREVVINERRQRVDNQPYGVAFERLHELLYPPAHPYHWPVIGYLEDIAAASMADVEDFFRRYYAPGNAVLSLAGDLDVERALADVERFFGPLPRGPELAPQATLPDPPPGERRLELEDDVQLARLYLAYRAPAYGTRAWYAADLLAAVLTGGKSSLLYQDLVYERQSARDVSAFVFPTELAASFVIVATAKPEVDAGELERVVDEHLQSLATRPVAEEHLERARNRLLTSFYASLQTLDHRADLLSQLTTYFDEPARLATEAERYQEIEAADVMSVARQVLSPERRAVVTVVPRRRGH